MIKEALENFFEFEIRKKGQGTYEQVPKSFAPPDEHSIDAVVSGGAGYLGHYIDISGSDAVNDNDYIRKWRQVSLIPECDRAIDDIVNEALIFDDNDCPVSLVLDNIDLPESVKEKIRDEFKTILSLLKFNYSGGDIFRKWYVDGRLYYHIIIDEKNKKSGIIELRPVDPLNIKKIREVNEDIDKNTGAKIVTSVRDYYVYNRIPTTVTGTSPNQTNGIEILPDSILYVPSGFTDATRRRTISPLNKAVKLANQLRWLEDSLVIYRLARAPERRIFYIDTGNLPKGKAEEYVQGIMNKYRNKVV